MCLVRCSANRTTFSGNIRPIAVAIEPYLNFLRALPPLGYIGLLIVWFGIGDASKIWLLFLAAFPAITIATLSGVQDVKEAQVNAARALGASRVHVVSHVILPYRRPRLLRGPADEYGADDRLHHRHRNHRADPRSAHQIRGRMGDAVAGEGVMTHNRRNTLGAVLVLLVIALTTSGCIVESGRSEQSRAIGEKVSCPVKPDPGIRTTARIGYQEVTNGDLIVKDTSLLQACMPNAKITWSKFSSGGDVLQGFKARSLDIALLGSAPAARALSAPLDIDMKVVWIQDVIGKAESLVVHDPAIRTLDQLRGKKIAVPFASTSHFSLLTALNRAGITDQVTLMNTQPDAMLAAWGNGIDAAWVWDPVLSKLKANGHVIDDSGVTAEQGAPTFDLEGARSDFVAQNGPFLKYWTIAQNWAVNLLNTDKPKAPSTAETTTARRQALRIAGSRVRTEHGIDEHRDIPAHDPGRGCQHGVGAAGVPGRAVHRRIERGCPVSAPTTVAEPIVLDGVSKTYPSSDGEVIALSPTSLTIEPGEFVAVVGPSGCGKTTLLQILASPRRPGRPPWAAPPSTGRTPTAVWSFRRPRCTRGSACAAMSSSGRGPVARTGQPARSGRWQRWIWWGSRTSPTSGPTSCPAACSSAHRSRGCSSTIRALC